MTDYQKKTEDTIGKMFGILISEFKQIADGNKGTSNGAFFDAKADQLMQIHRCVYAYWTELRNEKVTDMPKIVLTDPNKGGLPN